MSLQDRSGALLAVFMLEDAFIFVQTDSATGRIMRRHVYV